MTKHEKTPEVCRAQTAKVTLKNSLPQKMNSYVPREENYSSQMRPFEYIHSIPHPTLSPCRIFVTIHTLSLAGYLRIYLLEQVQEFAILLRRTDRYADAFVAVHFPSAEARYNSPVSHLHYSEPTREGAIFEVVAIRFENGWDTNMAMQARRASGRI
jgi:hypothetical protein